MSSQADASHGGRLQGKDLLLLAVAAASWPLGVWARNPTDFVHPERLLALVLGVWLVGLGVSWLLVRLGVSRTTAVRSVFISIVLLMAGGRLIRQTGVLAGWVVIVAIIALSAFVFARLGDAAGVRAAVAGLAVALASGVAISGYLSWSSYGESAVIETTSPQLDLVEHPDIFLVVIDGYPGIQAFRMDTGDAKTSLIDDLEARGFAVPSSAWSSYWSTQLSVASLLEMTYPATEPFDGDATTQALYDVIAGENRLFELMKREGYDTYVVESGWSGSACGANVDFCESSAFIDEAMFFTLWDTVAGPYLSSSIGHAFTLGTQKTMDWVVENAQRISSDDRPSFVFVHLVAPHLPLFLDRTCTTQVGAARSGSTFYHAGVDDAEREEYFAEQTHCIDSFMIKLADLTNPDTVVIFTGDHGTDRRAQLSTPPDEWGREATVERMNVMVAVRTAVGCSIGDPIMVPNLMRRVLSCYAGDEVSDNPNRMFIKPMAEVAMDELDSLLLLR